MQSLPDNTMAMASNKDWEKSPMDFLNDMRLIRCRWVRGRQGIVFCNSPSFCRWLHANSMCTPCIHGDSDANGWLTFVIELWIARVLVGHGYRPCHRGAPGLVTVVGSAYLAPLEDYRIGRWREYTLFIRCNHTSWNIILCCFSAVNSCCVLTL